MAEMAYSNLRGAEISERSSELVLPTSAAGETRNRVRGGETSVSESRLSSEPSGAQSAIAQDRSARTMSDVTGSSRMPAPENPATPEPTRAAERGRPLPGDRGPRTQAVQAQRPSFWRRIALGRRGRAAEAQPQQNTPAQAEGAVAQPTGMVPQSPESTPGPATAIAQPNLPTVESLENRIVEPMLQALVSVEAKLERSHVDLVGRSDQVEKRLTQLWDIEEQLGTLNELQDSLLEVSEQQRRLESAVVSQTTTIRWLVGAVFFSLAAAAFVVAAVLR